MRGVERRGEKERSREMTRKERRSAEKSREVRSGERRGADFRHDDGTRWKLGQVRRGELL